MAIHRLLVRPGQDRACEPDYRDKRDGAYVSGGLRAFRTGSIESGHGHDPS